MLAGPVIGPTDPVALDFDQVEAVDVPFADAFLGALLSGRLAGYHGEHPIVAINVSEGVRETLDATLRRRRLHLLGVTLGQPQLLGGDDILELTLRAALAAGRFSAADLARRLNITPQAMNNRLKILLESGALSRIRTPRARGGKEFEYQAPSFPDDRR
jgi:sugar/nucleoside kinase (ribokinase family)